MYEVVVILSLQISPSLGSLQLPFQGLLLSSILKAYLVAPATSFQDTVADVPLELQEPESPVGTAGTGQGVGVGVGVEVGAGGGGADVGVGVAVAAVPQPLPEIKTPPELAHRLRSALPPSQ